MTPEERSLLESLISRVENLENYKSLKEEQQITLPLDPVSVNIIGRALRDENYSL